MFTRISTRVSARPGGRRARRAWVAVAVCSAALLAGCASAPAPGPGSTASLAPGAPATAGYPVTIDNCGTEVTVSEPPERVVTVKSSTLELLLSLGLRDRIVGTAFSDGPVPARLAKEAEGLRVLSEKVPSQEIVLAEEPDLVFAGWESNLTAEGAGDRATLAGLGVATYVAPAACKGEGYMPDPLTFDEVFREFEEAGRLFGAQEQAAELVARQKAELAAIKPDGRGLRALWYSSGSDTPYVGAGIGAPQMIMGAAGLTNVAAGVHDTWTSMGWESIVDAAPDVIVLVDAEWNTAASKIAHLEANPATAAMPAVRERRYVTVEFPATEAGVRNVDAVASVVEQLAKSDVATQ